MFTTNTLLQPPKRENPPAHLHHRLQLALSKTNLLSYFYYFPTTMFSPSLRRGLYGPLSRSQFFHTGNREPSSSLSLSLSFFLYLLFSSFIIFLARFSFFIPLHISLVLSLIPIRCCLLGSGLFLLFGIWRCLRRWKGLLWIHPFMANLRFPRPNSSIRLLSRTTRNCTRYNFLLGFWSFLL